MLVQFGNIKLNLEILNLVVLGIFFTQLFPHWTVYSPITYTNVVFTLNLP